MNSTKDRLDPSQFSPEDIDRLSELVFFEERPQLVGREGVKIPLPDPVFHLLVRVVRAVKDGQAMVIMPETECFTTQAAANFLGVSRPFLVGLLEGNKIPHHKVGSHRRIYLKDLLEFQKRRDASRRKSLDQLTKEIEEAGVYDKIPPAEDA